MLLTVVFNCGEGEKGTWVLEGIFTGVVRWRERCCEVERVVLRGGERDVVRWRVRCCEVESEVL